ncbi:MAG: aminotransferase class I/II-fold pyridoxal phosphate-dependent enzyme [Alphaproteobacteria bacterium]|nr:aminotransferase class I/II-fold pyridoxal phosphate-dependent enzyme [Alphaproteobacteria bacterium]
MPSLLRPSRAVAAATIYGVPHAGAPVDLDLAGNLGLQVPDDLLPTDGALVRGYPDPGPLQAALAARLGVEPRQVLVTGGADDAIDRACRAMLEEGRNALFPEPGFVIVPDRIRLAGGTLRRLDWPGGAFPTDQAIALADEHTTLAVLTSPNNPTGAVCTADDLRRLSEALPQALLLVDLAYAEYADEDLTDAALALPNALVLRTLSKAWGLAGLRVGYAVGPVEIVDWLRAAGLPYTVSGVSAEAARTWLARGEAAMRAHVATAREERTAMEASLAEGGARVGASQGNFAFARVRDALWLRDGMAGLGIAVRAFPGVDGLEDAVRIGCPGDPAALRRCRDALRTVLRPDALLLDMDGVIADVRASYRQAIIRTCAHFGSTVDLDRVAAEKACGDANNDWRLCQRILAADGIDVGLDAITAVFEGLVQGTAEAPGLWRHERLCVPRERLAALAARLPLGIVTGRPRLDAERFLDHQGIADLFGAVICLEDAPPKPDPAPVRAALDALGLRHAWMVGDTPDDVRAARRAAVVPLGVVAPGEQASLVRPALVAAGAGRVLSSLDELLELLP